MNSEQSEWLANQVADDDGMAHSPPRRRSPWSNLLAWPDSFPTGNEIIEDLERNMREVFNHEPARTRAWADQYQQRPQRPTHDWNRTHERCRTCGVTAQDMVNGDADEFCPGSPDK